MDQETKKSGMGTGTTNLMDSVASQMVQRFGETGHAVFARANALSRGVLKRLKGKETIQFNADASNTELFFQIIHSANLPLS